MEKDNNCIPRSRNECGHPEHSERVKCCDFFVDAPLYTVVSVIVQQPSSLRAYYCAVSTERS